MMILDSPEWRIERGAKRSRAQAIRDRVKIRLAVNEAGPAIEAVLKENGIILESADWSKVFPHWLIATVDDDVIGCIQVVISKPIGYLEFLFVLPSAPFKFRAIAIRKLMTQGFETLRLAGCNYCGGVVWQTNKKFAGVIQKLNAVKMKPCDIYIKRLA